MADLRAAQILAAYPESAPVVDQLVALSDRLRLADPAALANLINFESNWNPAATAKSGATGLIQFIPSTAASLGTSTTALRGMTVSQQWPYVERYLLRFSGKIRDPIDLYMAVFYPKAIGNPSYEFPERVVLANAGIRTPTEYARMAGAKARMRFTSTTEMRAAPPGTQPRRAQVPAQQATQWHWWAAGTVFLAGIIWMSRRRG